MTQSNIITISAPESGRGTIRSYTIGFVLSLGLTLVAYLLVERHIGSLAFRMISIVCLAIGQLFVQLICFLHLGRESKPRWNLTVLTFAVLVVVVIVFGSLWIMYNLNYHMTPEQLQNYLKSQDGF